MEKTLYHLYDTLLKDYIIAYIDEIVEDSLLKCTVLKLKVLTFEKYSDNIYFIPTLVDSYLPKYFAQSAEPIQQWDIDSDFFSPKNKRTQILIEESHFYQSSIINEGVVYSRY